MKAAVLIETKKMLIQEIEKPNPGPGEVLVRVKTTGICGSELHAYHGQHALRLPPVILGHEVAGEVVEIGDTVTRVDIGDRVAIMPLLGCGKCQYCQEGEVNLCIAKKVLGTKVWPGSFAEFVLCPEDALFILPKKVDYELGALTEPLAVGIHAVNHARVNTNERVAVLGAGTIGLSIVYASALAGAASITVTDLAMANLQKAIELGAHKVLQASLDKSPSADVTGQEGFDVTFITASAPSLIDQAVRHTRKKGKIIVLATFEKAIPLDIQMSRTKEQWVSGTTMYTRADFEKAVAILADEDGLQLKTLISHRLPLEQVKDGFELLDKRAENVVKVLITLN